MSSVTAFQTRLPNDLYERLKDEARLGAWTMNSVVITALKEYFATRLPELDRSSGAYVRPGGGFSPVDKGDLVANLDAYITNTNLETQTLYYLLSGRAFQTHTASKIISSIYKNWDINIDIRKFDEIQKNNTGLLNKMFHHSNEALKDWDHFINLNRST